MITAAEGMSDGRSIASSELPERIRMAAETMAIGLLWLAFSLPVVTAGGAWCAAAEITAAWHRGEEPPLVRTFLRVTRRDCRAGLCLAALALGLVALVGLDARVAAAARLPGYRLEVAALAFVGVVVLAVAMLTVALRAATGCEWRAAIRTIWAPGVLGWRALCLVVAAIVPAIALALVVPAFAGFLAGPIAFAASVAVTRLGAPPTAGRGNGGTG